MFGIYKCFGNQNEQVLYNKKNNNLDSLDLLQDLDESSESVKQPVKPAETLSDSGVNLTPCIKHNSIYLDQSEASNSRLTNRILNQSALMMNKRKSCGLRGLMRTSKKVITSVRNSLADLSNNHKEILPTLDESLPDLFVEGKDFELPLSKIEESDPKRKKSLASILYKSMTSWEKLIALSGQAEVLEFEGYIKTAEVVRKLGEGSFAEVFITKTGTIMKIMPFDGHSEYNGGPQKTADEILPEIIINKKLSDLRHSDTNRTDGFVELAKSIVVRGPFPKSLTKMWEDYGDDKDSYNDHPEIFTETQLFIVLELANGGICLEDFQFKSNRQTYEVFVQLSVSLAIGESAYEFEHRDLHMANVLVSESVSGDVVPNSTGLSSLISSHSVKTTIIDYTLSRITFDGLDIFCDLKDEEDIFLGSEEIRQFDVYREMRKFNGNDWKPFEPVSNLLWLQYIGEMLLEFVIPEDNNVEMIFYRKKLGDIVISLMEYSSTVDFVENYLLCSRL